MSSVLTSDKFNSVLNYVNSGIDKSLYNEKTIKNISDFFNLELLPECSNVLLQKDLVNIRKTLDNLKLINQEYNKLGEFRDPFTGTINRLEKTLSTRFSAFSVSTNDQDLKNKLVSLKTYQNLLNYDSNTHWESAEVCLIAAKNLNKFVLETLLPLVIYFQTKEEKNELKALVKNLELLNTQFAGFGFIENRGLLGESIRTLKEKVYLQEASSIEEKKKNSSPSMQSSLVSSRISQFNQVKKAEIEPPKFAKLKSNERKTISSEEILQKILSRINNLDLGNLNFTKNVEDIIRDLENFSIQYSSAGPHLRELVSTLKILKTTKSFEKPTDMENLILKKLESKLVLLNLNTTYSSTPLYWTKKQDKDDRRGAGMICRIN